MWYSATVHAYDVMGAVQVTVTVRRSEGLGAASPEAVMHAATTVPGVGESDEREWLRDALVALLEAV
jgi:hypothetical protein